jgi:putative membrane protein
MRFSLSALVAAVMLVPSAAEAQLVSSRVSYVTFDDTRMLSILDAVNAAEVRVANMAATQAKRADVKEFALMLVRDHEQGQAKVRDLARKLNATPYPLDTTMAVKRVMDEGTRLMGVTGDDFDSQWLDHQVAMHQAMIAAVDGEYPAAGQPEIRALVDQMKPTMEMHLKRAKELRDIKP